MDQVKPRSVLFVCTMNAVRSPMAAGLLRHFKGRDLYVESAGVHAGELDPMTVQVMAELGIALTDHHPRSFGEFRGRDFDLVVALSREAEQHAKGGAATIEYWQTTDPTQVEGSYEQRKAAYRAVRDALKRQIAAKFG
ncbi:MAG TPA: arsenate reductase ArsC [Rhizomicrobium sp.]|jgi:protein-tyrosine-phosphatase|nr:arsenate reductase ArsC [Rhizomicrobium sp.]